MREHTGIDYTVKRSKRARTMRLAIYPDGNVVVTAPRFFGLQAIEDFVMKHSNWVRTKVEETRGRTILRIRRADIPALKKQALQLAIDRSEHFAAMYGVQYKKIAIRAQKSRWGSCSEKAHLSFNYKIAVLEPRLADYIIVHEICHIRQFDHSKAFWALVAEQFPDHRELREKLRNTATIFS